MNIHWKDWCWIWNSNTLTTWYEEVIHLKRPWRWERLRAGGEGDDRGWDGWMASPAQWTWVWVDSGSWWWTGRPGVLWFMGSQRVGHDWATELNWTEYLDSCICQEIVFSIHLKNLLWPQGSPIFEVIRQREKKNILTLSTGVYYQIVINQKSLEEKGFSISEKRRLEAISMSDKS